MHNGTRSCNRVKYIPQFNCMQNVRPICTLDKYDGHRAWLLLNDNVATLFLTENVIQIVCDMGEKKVQTCLLDGEYVDGMGFFAFDGVMVANIMCCDYKYSVRINLLRSFFIAYPFLSQYGIYDKYSVPNTHKIPSDGVIHVLTDNSYYETLVVKVPHVCSIDLYVDKQSKSAFAWSQETKQLLPVNVPPISVPASGVYSVDISQNKILERRYDKRYPNDMKTVMLYL